MCRRVSIWCMLVLVLAATSVMAGCATDDGETVSDWPPQEGLAVGDEAPDFRLKNQEQATIAVSDYRGVKNVALVFYPLAFTPV